MGESADCVLILNLWFIIWMCRSEWSLFAFGGIVVMGDEDEIFSLLYAAKFIFHFSLVMKAKQWSIFDPFSLCKLTNSFIHCLFTSFFRVVFVTRVNNKLFKKKTLVIVAYYFFQFILRYMKRK